MNTEKLLIEAKRLVSDIEMGKDKKYLYPTFGRIKMLLGPDYSMLDPTQRKALGFMYFYGLGTVDLDEKVTYVQGALNILLKAYVDLFGVKTKNYAVIKNAITNLDNAIAYADQCGSEPGTSSRVLQAAGNALNVIGHFAWSGMATFPDDDCFTIGGQINKKIGGEKNE